MLYILLTILYKKIMTVSYDKERKKQAQETWRQSLLGHR